MANPTTNYGFVLPTPTDLVTDLPADFDVALQGVDTRLKALQPGTTSGDLAYSSATANTNVRLPIGTSGQVLAVSGGGVPAWTTTADVTPLTTKGDLFTFTTVDARLGVGTNTHVLTADSAEATGLKWAAPAGGSDTYTTVTSSALSGLSTITVSSLNFNKLTIAAIDTVGSNTSADMQVRFNGSSTLADYDQGYIQQTNTSLAFYSYFGAVDSFVTADVGGTGGIWLNLENGKSTSKKLVEWVGAGSAQTGSHFNGYGFFNGSAAITSVTVFLSSGTWSSGTLNVYGA